MISVARSPGGSKLVSPDHRRPLELDQGISKYAVQFYVVQNMSSSRSWGPDCVQLLRRFLQLS